ncbi:antibiotic biosynthesis monooxygenase family protein [Yunchengibacter salinarum]|uniref:antibiotic biosynthesis monooxygenase family protein n=1 Tax=Yunchengibacter salinarum TaxID=3133399 RepID=UPI0035B66AB2
MFIAMNRFQVVKGEEENFERVWRERDTYLGEMEGFREFHLLRGPEADEYTLYSSHTVWESEDAFRAWTRSEAFAEAHRNAGANKHMYLGGPKFEGFTVVQQHGGDV